MTSSDPVRRDLLLVLDRVDAQEEQLAALEAEAVERLEEVNELRRRVHAERAELEAELRRRQDEIQVLTRDLVEAERRAADCKPLLNYGRHLRTALRALANRKPVYDRLGGLDLGTGRVLSREQADDVRDGLDTYVEGWRTSWLLTRPLADERT